MENHPWCWELRTSNESWAFQVQKPAIKRIQLVSNLAPKGSLLDPIYRSTWSSKLEVRSSHESFAVRVYTHRPQRLTKLEKHSVKLTAWEDQSWQSEHHTGVVDMRPLWWVALPGIHNRLFSITFVETAKLKNLKKSGQDWQDVQTLHVVKGLQLWRHWQFTWSACNRSWIVQSTKRPTTFNFMGIMLIILAGKNTTDFATKKSLKRGTVIKFILQVLLRTTRQMELDSPRMRKECKIWTERSQNNIGQRSFRGSEACHPIQ